MRPAGRVSPSAAWGRGRCCGSTRPGRSRTPRRPMTRSMPFSTSSSPRRRRRRRRCAQARSTASRCSGSLPGVRGRPRWSGSGMAGWSARLVPDRVSIQLVLNGAARTVAVEPHHTLLDSLREELGLTGAKSCCLVGECGACTVIVDGRAVDSCLVLAAEVDGADVRTVEGLAPAGGGLSTLQSAFLEHGAVQCGYCIPGQLMAAQALLERAPHPSDPEIEEGLAGNLCRCACYEQIFAAVRATAAAAGEGGAAIAVSAADQSPTTPASPAAREQETTLPPESM